VAFPHGNDILVYNFLTKDAALCAPANMYWLTVAPDWSTLDEISATHPQISDTTLKDEINGLISVGLLLEEGSDAAAREAMYCQSWELGAAAGFMHFNIMDNHYVDLAESVRGQKERALADPSPPLFWVNDKNALTLPKPGTNGTADLFDTMAHRRTRREVETVPITLAEISDCLFAGLGITGFVETEVATLPLKMTPSGGARNPYEAFVMVRNVEGLDAGFYHYSAIDHSLERVQTNHNYTAVELLNNQDWAENMPAVIFLVAVLRRTTWKYRDTNAYRVVLIEAGHVAQNMMLACTQHGLTACPTAALSHSKISSALGLTNLTNTPVYALAIGHPADSSDKVISLQEYQLS
jgi:SagB-type dehydrogenase family enzyme